MGATAYRDLRATFSGHSLPSSINYINTAAVSEGVLYNWLFKVWNSYIFEILQYLNLFSRRPLSLSLQLWCQRASVTCSHNAHSHRSWEEMSESVQNVKEMSTKLASLPSSQGKRLWMRVSWFFCGRYCSASRSSRPAPSSMSINNGVLECPRPLSYTFHLSARFAVSILAARSSTWPNFRCGGPQEISSRHGFQAWHSSRMCQQHICWTILLNPIAVFAFQLCKEILTSEGRAH